MMSMRRGFLAVVMLAWVAACGEDSTPPTGFTPQVISGSLTIHTRFWETGTEATSAYVLLGDGTRFLQTLDPSGDVTFEDPSLVGPQDVTLVARYDTGSVQAYTYLALERAEVWLPFVPQGGSAQEPQHAYITGTVTRRTSDQVVVKAVGQGVSGSATVEADGTYRLQVEGTLPAEVDLVAIDGAPAIRAVGLKRGIAVREGREVSGQDVSLDHPVDRRAQLNIHGASAYGQSFNAAALSFFQDDNYLFGMPAESSDASASWLPASVPTIALTAPFDTTRAAFTVNVGRSRRLPAGQASARVPVRNLSTATISLPEPMTLTAPVLGTSSEPGSASLRDLVFQWRTDASAQLAQLSITSDIDNPSGQFDWTVLGPGSVSSFKPFSLPVGDRASSSPFTPGKYRILLGSRRVGAIGRYADFFTEKPASDATSSLWWTLLDGAVELH